MTGRRGISDIGRGCVDEGDGGRSLAVWLEGNHKDVSSVEGD